MTCHQLSQLQFVVLLPPPFTFQIMKLDAIGCGTLLYITDTFHSMLLAVMTYSRHVYLKSVVSELNLSLIINLLVVKPTQVWLVSSWFSDEVIKNCKLQGLFTLQS